MPNQDINWDCYIDPPYDGRYDEYDPTEENEVEDYEEEIQYPYFLEDEDEEILHLIKTEPKEGKTMNIEEIRKTIKEDTDHYVEIYHDTFRVICENVTINDFCFRDVQEINIVNEKVLWINRSSIDIEDIHRFEVRKSYTNENEKGEEQ